jgi:hypothetical protein
LGFKSHLSCQEGKRRWAVKKLLSLFLIVLFLSVASEAEGKGKKRKRQRRGGDVVLAVRNHRLVNHMLDIMRRSGEFPQVVVTPPPACGSEGQPPCPEVKKPSPTVKKRVKKPARRRRR